MSQTEQKPKIELKALKICDWASEETTCFTASLYFDGKRIGTVRNDGNGGCHAYDYTDHKKGAEFEKHCRSLPPTDTDYGSLDMNEDRFLNELIEKMETEKAIKNLRKKGNLVFRLKGDGDGQVRTIMVGTAQGNNHQLAELHVRNQYGNQITDLFLPL